MSREYPRAGQCRHGVPIDQISPRKPRRSGRGQRRRVPNIACMETGDWFTLIATIIGAVGLVWAMLFQLTRANTTTMREGVGDKLEAVRLEISGLRENADTNLEALRTDVLAEVKVAGGKVEALDRDMASRFAALDRDMAGRFEATDTKIAALRQEMTIRFGALTSQMTALQQYVDARIEAQTAEQSAQKEGLEEALARVRLMQEALTSAGNAGGP